MPTNSSNIVLTIGIGEGGAQAVSHMYTIGLGDTDFLIIDNDQLSVNKASVIRKILIGPEIIQGKESGSFTGIGQKAAKESKIEIEKELENRKLVFIVAGLGGVTGTEAAPVVAAMAKKLGILTIGVVTMPFSFEGTQKLKQAINGLDTIRRNVDLLIVISNDHLIRPDRDISVADAFSKADAMLWLAVRSVKDIVAVRGPYGFYVGDIETITTDSGFGFITTGEASGEHRTVHAVERAVSSPLLGSNSILSEKTLMVNIASGQNEVTMDEISEMHNHLINLIGNDTAIYWSVSNDWSLGEKVRFSIIGTGDKETNFINSLE